MILGNLYNYYICLSLMLQGKADIGSLGTDIQVLKTVIMKLAGLTGHVG